jgi:hypothetical protein
MLCIEFCLQIEGDVKLPAEKPDVSDDVTSSALDRDVYGLLAVNRNKSPDQSWVGIGKSLVTD